MQPEGAVLRKPLHRALRGGRSQEPEGGAKKGMQLAQNEQGRSQGSCDGALKLAQQPQELT